MQSYSISTNNSLEKFRKNIAGKKNIPQDIDSKFNPSGDFVSLEGIDTIIRGLTTILLTSSDTYLFDPTFGVGLYRFIFEPQDEVTKSEIEEEVSNAISRYESRASISSSVVFLTNVKGFRVDIFIKYQGEQRRVHVTIDESLIRTLPPN